MTAASTKPPSNLVLRLGTAAVAVPPILFLLYKGPAWGFYLLAFPAAMLACYELFGMTHPKDKVSQVVGVLLGDNWGGKDAVQTPPLFGLGPIVRDDAGSGVAALFGDLLADI